MLSAVSPMPISAGPPALIGVEVASQSQEVDVSFVRKGNPRRGRRRVGNGCLAEWHRPKRAEAAQQGQEVNLAMAGKGMLDVNAGESQTVASQNGTGRSTRKSRFVSRSKAMPWAGAARDKTQSPRRLA